MNRLWVMWAFALLAAAPALAGVPAPADEPASAFTEEVFTQPSQVISLAAPVGGILKRVEVEEGQVVKAGEVVVVLEDAAEAIALKAARLEAENAAEEESARLTMEQAKEEAAIVKQLSSEGVEAKLLQRQKELAAEVARCKFEVAKKARERAAVDLEAAQYAFERRKIRTPVAAVVTRRQKEVGEAVQPLDTVAQLAVTDTLHVLIHPPARMLGRFRAGQAVPVEILEPQPQTVTAKVDVVNEVADSASNTFRVRLAVDNADGRLRAGVRARVSVAGPEGPKNP
jgi:RND family efflux transporter MFP subunit